jgi:adenylosuccinate synthase
LADRKQRLENRSHFYQQKSACDYALPHPLDTYREEEHGGTQIGTTKKGIGPCYEDKIARVGIRMVDLTKS